MIEETYGLAKKAINGLLGVWSIDKHYSWIVNTQQDEYHTLAFDDKLLVRPGAPGGMIDVCYRIRQLTASSMRPIVHTVLDRERTIVAECRRVLYTLGCVPRHIKQARVDSFTLQPPKKLLPAVLALDQMTYADLSRVYRGKLIPPGPGE